MTTSVERMKPVIQTRGFAVIGGRRHRFLPLARSISRRGAHNNHRPQGCSAIPAAVSREVEARLMS